MDFPIFNSSELNVTKEQPGNILISIVIYCIEYLISYISSFNSSAINAAKYQSDKQMQSE